MFPIIFGATVTDRAKWREEQRKAGAMQDSWAL